ncbi:MAG: protease inhibitor I42 family protein [Deltaproteobacteria bacterium]|nr:protease inhibitor I42 family protein [Deltaproteobacteria bacterium]
MARISKQAVNAALKQAAAHIIDAAKSDGRASRADMKAKLQELDGTEKKLTDIFFRFVDKRDFKAGAQVTAKDVQRAVTYAKEHMIDNYDLNNNGLSKTEIAKMSVTGKLAVQLARELKEAAATAGSGDSKTITVAKGEPVVLELPANATTGFQWSVISTDRSFGYPQEDYIQGGPGIGTGGTARFTWDTDNPFVAAGSTHMVTLAYARPWEHGTPPAKTFELTVNITD